MDFVKKNLIMIISAAVSLLSLVGLFLGISQIGGLQEVLAKAQQAMGDVETVLKGVPVEIPGGRTANLIPTEKAIENQKGREAVSKEQGLKTLRKALQENIGYDPVKKTLKRQPMMDGIFPKPSSDDRPYKFPKVYQDAIKKLMVKLQAGEVPTEKEIADEKEQVVQEQGFMPSKEGKPSGATARTVGARSGMNSRNNPVEEDPLQDLDLVARLRAAENRAKEIKVYCELAQPNTSGSQYQTALDILSDVAYPTGGTPPLVEDMWWAQLSYWIQEDIAGAISEVNASAKNVIESPIKRILQIKVMHGYVVQGENGRMEFVGREELQAPVSFSNLSSDKNYDILQFKVELIMDERAIPSFVDAMYRQSHYLLYNWETEAFVPPDITKEANNRSSDILYRYGNSPLVKLTTYWEAYLFRDFYHWGIVGYGVNSETGKSYVILYNSDKPFELEDMEKRTGMTGLMPKAIRQILGSEESDGDSSSEGRSGMDRPSPSRSRHSGGSRRSGGSGGDLGD